MPGPQPESIRVEYHPVRHITFDLTPAAPPPGRITFVQSQGGNSTGNSTSAIFDSNVTAGNLLVVALGGSALSAVDFAILTDTLGNSFTLAGTYGNTGDGTYGIGLFYAVTGSSGADTVSFVSHNPSSTFTRCLIHEFSGVTALDQFSTSNGAIFPLDSGAMNTTAANEVVFGWGVSDNGITTIGAGFTLGRTQANQTTEYQIVSATGTYHATFPGDGANNSWGCIGATFK